MAIIAITKKIIPLKLPILLFFIGIIAYSCNPGEGNSTAGTCNYTKEMHNLADRLLPGNRSKFRFKIITESSDNALDVFEIDSKRGKIVISGNNGVSLAAGLNWYLKNYCNCQISLNYNQLKLPDPLPVPTEKIRIETPFKYRYIFNYCTYGYSMPWWDWEKWEKVIDYMALMGINMPLAPIGQEAVWDTVYKEMGLTDKMMKDFFVGPAHLPWGRMGNIDGVDGPLPDNWIKKRKELQKKILNRMRSYGMTPVLQAFTGHVPKELKEFYPNADIIQINDWAGIPGTMFLNPADTLFNYIGNLFIKRQTEMYGTDHLYDADCFIEVDPPSSDTTYLSQLSRAIYNSMATVDEEAIWVMQGWFFFFRQNFWQKEQGRAFVGSVPDNKLIVLDLYGEKNTTWDKTESFFGQPWIWNVICNEDQKVNMSGDLKQMQINFREAFEKEINNNLTGIGTIPEGVGYNPVVQDFIYEKAWDPSEVNLETWVRNYASRRYGSSNPYALEAWELLLGSVYSRTRTIWNPLITTPRLQIFKGPAEDIRHVRPEIIITPENPLGMDFDVTKLYEASLKMLECEEELKSSESFRFDLVNIHRELLVSLTHLFIHELTDAFTRKNITDFVNATDNILELLSDLDRLTGTHEMFLLGNWIEDARSWGENKEESNYYEKNARTIISIWQPWKDGYLRDYAGKYWNGMFRSYYFPRWELFTDMLAESLQKEEKFEYRDFDKKVRELDYNWTHSHTKFITIPEGDLFDIVKDINEKYKNYYIY